MLENIDTLKSIMDSASAKEELDSEKLSKLVTMEKEQADKLMLLYTYKQGNTSEWKISAKEFIDFLISDVLGNEDFADKFDEENKKQLNNLSKIINAVYFSEKYDSTGMAELFGSMSEDMDENTVKLLFLYHDANINDISDKTMSITELMSYLSDVLIYDETFGPVLDDEMKEDIKESAVDLRDGVKQLKGDKYSRLILSVTVPEEGPEAEEFYNTVTSMFSVLKNDYHLIGSSAMNYEMSKTFDGELLTITLLTALAIFLVVLITFRNAAVPAILVLLVQCGVYITVSVIGIQGYSIHYLALLIVQCILMGSTIDYAILFSTYYRECRKTNKPAEALKEAFSGSMHTILTSGLIMVTITGILGQCFGDPTVEQICQTISIGAASAIILIIFILPGILSCLDRFTAGKDRLKEK
jgi:predicted RND superfamily exporter protein